MCFGGKATHKDQRNNGFLDKIENKILFFPFLFSLSLHLNTPVAWRPNVSTTGGPECTNIHSFL